MELYLCCTIFLFALSTGRKLTEMGEVTLQRAHTQVLGQQKCSPRVNVVRIIHQQNDTARIIYQNDHKYFLFLTPKSPLICINPQRWSIKNHPWKRLPKATGASFFFFIPVLRVKNPLRIWLLPDSEQATGNLLTRDDSGEKFRVLQGCWVKAARVSLHFLDGHSGRPSAALSLHCEGPDVGKASSPRNDLQCIVYLSLFCKAAVPSSKTQGRELPSDWMI